jgi:hypothetical protein
MSLDITGKRDACASSALQCTGVPSQASRLCSIVAVILVKIGRLSQGRFIRQYSVYQPTHIT